jgi:hypothetical protein
MLRSRALPAFVLPLAACAQLAGLDNTTKAAIDAPGAIDAPPADMPPADAAPCVGGDIHATDQATGACYIFFVAPLAREDARLSCLTLGATTLLVSINDAAENTLVKQLIGNTLALLGGSDGAAEGTFVWPDGTGLTFTAFNTGEPNNGNGMLDEDCLVMHGELGGVWDDRPCAPVAGSPVSGAYSYVCERD